MSHNAQLSLPLSSMSRITIFSTYKDSHMTSFLATSYPPLSRILVSPSVLCILSLRTHWCLYYLLITLAEMLHHFDLTCLYGLCSRNCIPLDTSVLYGVLHFGCIPYHTYHPLDEALHLTHPRSPSKSYHMGSVHYASHVTSLVQFGWAMHAKCIPSHTLFRAGYTRFVSASSFG